MRQPRLELGPTASASARRVRRRGLAVVVTAALLAPVWLSGATSPTLAAPGEPIALSVSTFSDEPSLVDAIEADLGRRLDSVRVFKKWDDAFPSADDLLLLDGRDMVLSIKPSANGVKIPWADIAAATPGDALYDDIVGWAQAIAPFQGQIWLTFHHEPEARVNLPHGTDAEFIAAWRNFMTIVAGHGVAVKGRVMIFTDYAFHLPSTDRRHAPKWYPGDEWVDAAAIDAYNWHHCRDGIFTRWMSLQEIVEPFREWGAARPQVELMLTEVGSAQDPELPNRRTEWIDAAAQLLQQPGYEQFTYFSWFHLQDSSQPRCDWRVQGTPAMAAFARLADLPAFGGPGVLPPPPTTTTIATTTTSTPPAGDPCTVTRLDADNLIEWQDTGGRHVLRRDGAWLATPGRDVTSYVDVGASTDAVYEVRTWAGGVRADLPCTPAADPVTTTTTAPTTATTLPITTTTSTTTTTTTTSTTTTTVPITTTTTSTTTTTTVVPTTTTTTTTVAPPVGCVSTRVGDDNVVTWTDDGGLHVMRRDGSWLATPGEGVDTFVDVGGPAGASYELRTWTAGGRIDQLCS